jgi:hypothetical protein
VLACLQDHGGQLALYNAAYASQTSMAASPCSSRDTSEHISTAAAAAEPAGGYFAGEPALLVSPTAGRLLLFDSRIPHEVLPAHRHRYSITCWFYKQQSSKHLPAQQGAAAPAMDTVPGPWQTPSSDAPCSDTCSEQQQQGNNVCTPTLHDAPGSSPDEASVEGNQSSDAAIPLKVGINTSSSSSNSSDTRHKTIFVSIAAFRDAECQWTLRDMFLKAAHPDRVTAGVVWQVDPVHDAAFVRMAGGEKTAKFQQQVSALKKGCTIRTVLDCANRGVAVVSSMTKHKLLLLLLLYLLLLAVTAADAAVSGA